MLPIPSVVPELQRVTVHTDDGIRLGGAGLRTRRERATGPLVERIGRWASETING